MLWSKKFSKFLFSCFFEFSILLKIFREIFKTNLHVLLLPFFMCVKIEIEREDKKEERKKDKISYKMSKIIKNIDIFNKKYKK